MLVRCPKPSAPPDVLEFPDDFPSGTCTKCVVEIGIDVLADGSDGTVAQCKLTDSLMRGRQAFVIPTRFVGAETGFEQDHVTMVVREICDISNGSRPRSFKLSMTSAGRASGNRTIRPFSKGERVRQTVRDVSNACAAVSVEDTSTL